MKTTTKNILIEIDNQSVEISEGRTILEAARQKGLDIPTLCHSERCGSGESCMVCAVRDAKTKQLLPSCSTKVKEGMQIESSSKEIEDFRRTAVELLLSEHLGACESLCTTACPQDLAIPFFALQVGTRKENWKFTFDLSICKKCGGKCERACRRGRYDVPFQIRDTLKEAAQNTPPELPKGEKPAYNHLFGKVAKEDIQNMVEFLPQNPEGSDLQKEALRCLQCACAAKSDCQLRYAATILDAKQKAFRNDNPPTFKLVDAGKIIFEPGKCILCGRCVRLGEQLKPGTGPVVAFRGPKAIISPPFGMEYKDLFEGFEEDFVRECPTGALYIRWDSKRNPDGSC